MFNIKVNKIVQFKNVIFFTVLFLLKRADFQIKKKTQSPQSTNA